MSTKLIERNQFFVLLYSLNFTAYLYGMFKPFAAIGLKSINSGTFTPVVLLFSNRYAEVEILEDRFYTLSEVYRQSGPFGITTLIMVISLVGLLVSLFTLYGTNRESQAPEVFFYPMLIFELLFIVAISAFRRTAVPDDQFDMTSFEHASVLYWPGTVVYLIVLLNIIYILYQYLSNQGRK